MVPQFSNNLHVLLGTSMKRLRGSLLSWACLLIFMPQSSAIHMWLRNLIRIPTFIETPNAGSSQPANHCWLQCSPQNLITSVCEDSRPRHSRLGKAGRYRFMQVNEMENSAVTDWDNHNLGSTIILASVHYPDDPLPLRMQSRNTQELLQSGVLNIAEFASTNCLSDLYFFQVKTWLTLLSLSNPMRSSHWCIGIRQDDANTSKVVIFKIKHRASLDVPSQVFSSTEKFSSFEQSHVVQVGATSFLSISNISGVVWRLGTTLISKDGLNT